MEDDTAGTLLGTPLAPKNEFLLLFRFVFGYLWAPSAHIFGPLWAQLSLLRRPGSFLLAAFVLHAFWEGTVEPKAL